MIKYLVKQPKHKEINDETAFKISRGKQYSCRRALDDGLYRDAGYINAEDLNEVFAIGNTEPEKVEKIGKFYSISCGDIIVDTSNRFAYLVAPIGFTLIKVSVDIEALRGEN